MSSGSKKSGKSKRQELEHGGSTEEIIQNILQKLENARSENKTRRSNRVQKLENEMREILEVSPESWIDPKLKLDELIKKIKECFIGKPKLVTSEFLSDEKLLQKVSGGIVLRGVFITKYVEDELQEREFVLAVPDKVMVIKDYQSDDQRMSFSSSEIENECKKKVKIFGHSVISSFFPETGSASIFSESDKNYLSTVKFCTIQLGKYSFKRKDVRLSKDAKEDLKAVHNILNANEPDSSIMEDACKKFFSTYGSHVHIGPITFGGHFWWTCSTNGFHLEEKEIVQEIHDQVISATTGSSFASSEPAGANITAIKELYQGKCSKGTLANTNLQPNVCGGPPEATSVPQWRSGLVSNNNTWVVTDRGEKQMPLWEIIQENYKDEFGSNLSDALKNIWEKLIDDNGTEEQQQIIRLGSGLTWHNEEELSPQKTMENLLFLCKQKNDIIESGQLRISWIRDYLLLPPVQHLLLSIVNSDLRPSDLEHVKFLMRQLFEMEDFVQLNSQVFPNIEKIYSFLYNSKNAVPKQPNIINNFDSFVTFLDSVLTSIVTAHLDSEIPRLDNLLLSKETIAAINHGIHSLQCCYEKTYTQILITILVLPFKESNFLNQTTLNDLQDLYKYFIDEMDKLEKYLNNGKPLHLQAYLLNLSLDFYHATEGLEQVCKMMKDFEIPLEEPLANIVNDKESSFGEIKECSQTLMTTHQPTLYHPAVLPSRNCPEQPLQKALKTTFDTPTSLIPKPADINKSSMAYKLLEKLGLSDYYPKKLQLQDALCISFEPLELSLGLKCPDDPRQLPKLVLQKVMAYDYLCRSDLMHPCIEQAKYGDDVDGDSDDGCDDDDGDDNKISQGETTYRSDLGSDEDTSDSYDSEDMEIIESDTVPSHQESKTINLTTTSDDEYFDALSDQDPSEIHPLDSLLAVILCSDDFLRQDLISRLAKCQLAIPFVIPDPFTKQLHIPLWAMRSIVKEFKSARKQKQHPIIQHKMPIVSFIRIGEHPPQCISKILNEVISGSSHEHFFHHDCHGAQYNLVLGQGVVNMSWYLPAGKKSDAFSTAVTFLNLNGDARNHLQQAKFLSQISSMCFIQLTESIDFSKESLKILKKFASSQGGITLFNNVGDIPSALKRNDIKVDNFNMKREGFNLAQMKDKILFQIKRKHQEKLSLRSIEECCYKIDKGILVDEKFDPNIKLALEFAKKVRQEVADKKDSIPVQGLWKDWADKDKETHRQTRRGNRTVNDYADEIKSKKDKIRMEQLESAETLTPLMKSFIVSLLKLGGASNRVLRNHFLQCLKLDLNISSMEKVSAMQQQYFSTRTKLVELQNSPGTKSDEEKTLIMKYKEEMKKHQQEITDASFGLEHLFREIGQIYEAARHSLRYSDELSCLPKAAAELLIDGYPLELMDGDVAHVPLMWVTAVINEAVKMLQDPKVYVLSVLGLQSTGKSTMLNTVFGLQFNVSAGRCTRGAFMRLLKVGEKLRLKTGFSYVLVIDTEGLRAPELSHLLAQNHDNELATFVIGLANKTLVNIYGEVPGDIDDILQTAVHAFLRMKQIKHKPSCQFVHQNAEANKNNAVSHGNFTDKLNEFTVLAAKSENLQGHFETFNDVINFDDRKDIFFFPGLWQGDPPMAPVNQGYSMSSQELKLSFIKSLVEGKSEGSRDCHLSSFHIKLRDFWKALLTEKFVFSFRNTLEITAYNSIEAAYMNLEWRFKAGMLDWEQKAKNEISTAHSESVPDLVKQKLKELVVYLSELYEPLKAELNNLFVGQWSDIVVQWKANFEMRLRSISKDLESHAKKICIQLQQSKLAITKIENEREQYKERITKKVQDIIPSVKREQEQFEEDLERGQWDETHLDELLKEKLFTHENLMEYTELDESKVNFINAIIERSNGQLTGSGLRNIIAEIGIEHAKKILVEEQLKIKFNEIWHKMIHEFQIQVDDEVDIEVEVEKVLLQFVGSKGYEGQIIEAIRHGRQKLQHWANRHLIPEENKHFLNSSNFLGRGMEYFNLRKNDRHQIAQEITNKIFAKAEQCLQAITSNDIDFNTSFTYQLLYDVDQEIISLPQSEGMNNVIKFTREYNLEVYLHVCGRAIARFEKMSKLFKERHDPCTYLERYVKNPLFTHFKNQVYLIQAEVAIASKLCACLEEPIKEQIENTVVQKIVSEMRISEQHLSSKMALKVKILTDLYQKNDFRSYMVYVTDVRRSLSDWLEQYTVLYCDNQSMNEDSRLQELVKNEISRLVGVARFEVEAINEANANKCFSDFCNNMKLRGELGVNLKVSDLQTGYESLEELNLNNFKLQVCNGLQKLKEKLHSRYSSIKCALKMSYWKDDLHDFFEDLIGCTAQCPFCNEQCDLLDPKHVDNGQKHRTSVHRPSCLGSWRRSSDNMLTIEICPSEVASDGSFKCEATHRQYHPFKDYQSIYPNWSIPPDVTSEDSKYWKLFVSKYKYEIAQLFSANPPNVPQGWSDIPWEEVSENLRQLYKL